VDLILEGPRSVGGKGNDVGGNQKNRRGPTRLGEKNESRNLREVGKKRIRGEREYRDTEKGRMFGDFKTGVRKFLRNLTQEGARKGSVDQFKQEQGSHLIRKKKKETDKIILTGEA